MLCNAYVACEIQSLIKLFYLTNSFTIHKQLYFGVLAYDIEYCYEVLETQSHFDLGIGNTMMV